jgi:LysB family phage lysis regulatory protein
MKAFAVAFVVGLVALLLIGFQQYRYVDLQGDLTVETKSKQDAIAANTESQATITSLRAEAQRNAAYQADLAKRLKDSEQKALKARKDFEQLKRTSKPVRDWAAQPLPDGLRGKPAATGGKDNGGKARTP